MDGQNYLNQISTSVRPAKKTSSNFMNSKVAKIAIGGIAAFMLIAIIGGIMSSGRSSIQSRAVSLKYHIDNTLGVISTYQPNIKSSTLRSNSASLYSVLSNTTIELTNYLVDNYKYKDNDKSYKTLANNASLNSDALSQSLFQAKINGVLDEIYMSKMAYEISSIMSEEATVYNSTSNQELESILSTSYSSLDTLLPLFSDATAD